MRPAAYPVTALLLLCAHAASAQLTAQPRPSAAIPATPPTQSVSDLPSAHPNAVATNLIQASDVTWDGSDLTIAANGEPMPELLGRVAHETGMKITGGVPDERIFGKYGPAPVQVVLGQLFDGLSINMMLVNATQTKPKELLLTVRSGAASPPSTRQVSDNYQPRRQPQPIQPIAQQPPPGSPQQRPNNQAAPSAFPPLAPPPADNTAFTNNGNAATTANSTPTTSTPTTSTSPDSSQPQSPNGVKTPEQIFEELRKRQQQQSTQ